MCEDVLLGLFDTAQTSRAFWEQLVHFGEDDDRGDSESFAHFYVWYQMLSL